MQPKDRQRKRRKPLPNTTIDALLGMTEIPYCDPDIRSGIPAPRRMAVWGCGELR